MNIAIALFLAANAMRPGGDMRDVSMRPPSGSAPGVVIAAMPFARTVTCTGDYELTGTAPGAGAVTWSASPSGDSGACTGTGSWSCIVAVAPALAGEGVETVTVSQSGASSGTVQIGFYVDGAHSCFLAQDIDGAYNASLLDLDPVTDWVNSGTSSLNVTQAVGSAQPTYLTGVVNGQPVVSCDGSDFIQASTAADWTFMSDGTGASAHIATLTSSSALQQFAGTSTGGTTNTGFGWRSTAAQASMFFVSDGASLVINSTSAGATIQVNKFHAFDSTLATADTPDLTQYVDGVSKGTASAALSAGAPANPFAMCGRPTGGTQPYFGEHFAVIVYSSSLTSTQRGINLEVDEWALGGTLPVTP